MAPNRNEFLAFARRLHNAFQGVINRGDGSPNWEQNKTLFTHHTCGMYLCGCLSYLEGKYGKTCWQDPGVDDTDFDHFIQNQENENLKNAGVGIAGFNALVCVRNAYAHNASDLSENDDEESLQKVTRAELPGVKLDGPIFELVSDGRTDFTEYVRKCLVGVAQYFGDG